MKKDVEIIIRSSQVMDGDCEEMELNTLGRFYEKDGLYYLSYDETEATGFEGHNTVLKFGTEPKVTMTRFGKAHSQLVIELNECNSCNYNTEYGSMCIDVRGRQHEAKLHEDGGRLFLAYGLDLGGGISSYNEIELIWKHLPAGEASGEE